MKYILGLLCSLSILLNAVSNAEAYDLSRPYVQGEVIVKLKSVKQAAVAPGSGKQQSKVTSAKAHNDNFVAKMGAFKGGLDHKGEFAGLNMHYFKARNQQVDMKQMLDELAADSDVEYVEPNYILQKMSADAAAQGYSWAQVQSMGGTFSLTGADIQMSAAWGQVVPSTNPIVVAVIDTGVDYNHSALVGNIWTNPGEVAGNGVDDDHNGYVDDVRGWNFAYGNNNPLDDDGHGTHVAGIVVGTTQDLFVPAPANPVVRIMPLKFLDSNGSGSTANAISAVYYASNMGARVMNNSWGGGSYSRGLDEAIAYAYNSKDVVFVAAAGNASSNNDAAPTFPASYGAYNIISVAATNDYDQLASFSNFGASTVHLSAPGVGILSTYPNNYYAYLSGTSMATPFVTGIVAQMRHESPTMNSYQVKQLVLASVDPISGLNGKVSTQGRVDSLTSVMAAKTTAVSAQKPTYSVVPNSADRDLASSMASRGAGCGSLALLKDYVSGRGGGAGPLNDLKTAIIIFAILLAPLFILSSVRRLDFNPASKRRFERFEIDSKVSFKVGGQEFSGAMHTISVGGSDLDTEALLSKGSVITMTIASPDGKQQVQVQGQVVWSAETKKYGIEFKDMADSIRSQIAGWTAQLSKAS